MMESIYLLPPLPAVMRRRCRGLVNFAIFACRCRPTPPQQCRNVHAIVLSSHTSLLLAIAIASHPPLPPPVRRHCTAAVVANASSSSSPPPPRPLLSHCVSSPPPASRPQHRAVEAIGSMRRSTFVCQGGSSEHQPSAATVRGRNISWTHRLLHRLSCHLDLGTPLSLSRPASCRCRRCRAAATLPAAVLLPMMLRGRRTAKLAAVATALWNSFIYFLLLPPLRIGIIEDSSTLPFCLPPLPNATTVMPLSSFYTSLLLAIPIPPLSPARQHCRRRCKCMLFIIVLRYLFWVLIYESHVTSL